MKIRRIAILGTGDVARDHAVVATHLGAQVVAGTASSPQSAKWQAFHQLYPTADYVADGTRLLDDPGIDAVIACLPWRMQPDWAERLLACSKPVLVEKPLGIEAAALHAALSRPGLHLDGKLIGFNRRYYATVARLRDRLAEGGLRSGQIVISEEVGRLVARHGPGILPYTLETSSCHILDLALHLFGGLRIVSGLAHDESRYTHSFTSYNGLFQAEGGEPVAYFINADDPSAVGITCRFDDGTAWTLTPSERLVVYRGYDVIERNEECQVRRYTPHVAESSSVDARFRPGFLEQMTAFLSGDFGAGARPHDNLRLLELCAGLKASPRKGQSR